MVTKILPKFSFFFFCSSKNLFIDQRRFKKIMLLQTRFSQHCGFCLWQTFTIMELEVAHLCRNLCARIYHFEWKFYHSNRKDLISLDTVTSCESFTMSIRSMISLNENSGKLVEILFWKYKVASFIFFFT